MFPEVVNQPNTENQKKVAADHWVLTQDFKFMELPLHWPLKQEHQGAKSEGSSASLPKEIRTIS